MKTKIQTLTRRLLLLVSFVAVTTLHASTDYGPAIYRPMSGCTKWYTSGNGHHFCTIHDMEGYYASTIGYLNRCDINVSIHFEVNGKQDTSTDMPAGEISQSVRTAYYAWHAVCWNTWMWGTEHEGFASNPAWYTEAMYQASSGLQRHLMSQTTHPMDRNHIVGHGEKSNAGWVNWMAANYPSIDATCNSHTDPGPYWDWAHFMALVAGGTDNAAFVSKTVADGAQFSPGQAFSCTYTMNNNGTTTWIANGGSGYTLNYASGTQMGAATINPISANVAPGGNASITVNFTAPATAGSYSVTFRMNNSPGAFFGASVPLSINVASAAPVITTQPQSQTVAQGASATFSVGASGAAPLSYQWKFNGVNISGANASSYTRSNAQVADQGNYSVTVSNGAGSVTSANASLMVKVSATVDNSDAGFSVVGTGWATGTSSTDKFGADYRFRPTAAVSEPAQWTATLGNTGTYAISAWWTQGANRSAAAPYIVTHSTGSTTVNKNQQSGGGAWQSLGSFSLDAGSNNVKLSCWAATGFVVVADAIKWAQ
jgi:N-acetyl-anhydromuramyl-L-alanine amidase AmpD